MPRFVRRLALLALAATLAACASVDVRATDARPPSADSAAAKSAATMQIHYLEIVTPEVDATCAALAELHGVAFGDPAPELGNARTAELPGGGLLGVRAPMRATEQPVVRPYVLVDDIAAACAAATAAGGQVALPPMEIPGRGTYAIYLQGGIEHGLWQR